VLTSQSTFQSSSDLSAFYCQYYLDEATFTSDATAAVVDFVASSFTGTG